MQQNSGSIPAEGIGWIVDGTEHHTGTRLEVRSPYDRSLIANIWQPTWMDAQRAVAAAVAGFARTSGLGSWERQNILTAVAARLQSEHEQFAQTIMREAGKPITAARAEVDRAILTFRVAAEESTRMGGEVLPLDLVPSSAGRWGLSRRFPCGPVLAITPFNFPLNLVAHKLAPAIACGCPVILKPAPQTPFSSWLLVRSILEAGWPTEALAFLPLSNEDTSRLVAEDDRIRLVSFTGSAGVGWGLKSLAKKKRVVLELGGNAAMIVHRDWQDIEGAAHSVVNGGFGYSGQSCISVQRVYVQQSIFKPFCDAVLNQVEKLRVGDPALDSTDVGPLIRERDAERVEAWIDEAIRDGATQLAGGKRTGSVIRPTVLTGTRSPMKVSDEEIFGPVISVESYEKLADAITAVNASRYGLQAGLLTRDAGLIQEAYRALQVGALIVGDVPTWRLDSMPYGGVKDSGAGREGVRYAMEEMTEPRLLVMALKPSSQA
ncbi:MAG TPA: aldehyde dehydrogenase family protein [Acidobacteriaceae bacterium]|nr:aldehyde dehydrogenase family protein [Acidobacteriaceae bacterium]